MLDFMFFIKRFLRANYLIIFTIFILLNNNVCLAQDEALANLYQHKCSLCHGASGKGDGKLAALINKPSPADFTQSQLDLNAIKLMIEEGGEANGRSASMPAWKTELDPKSISRLAEYVFAFRKIE